MRDSFSLRRREKMANKITHQDKEMICQTYRDAEDKEKAVSALAKVIGCEVSAINKVLRENGLIKPRVEIKAEKTKEPADQDVKIYKKGVQFVENIEQVKKDPKEAAGPCESQEKKMPEFVQDILFKELSQLERELVTLQESIEAVQKRYEALKDYLFS